MPTFIALTRVSTGLETVINFDYVRSFDESATGTRLTFAPQGVVLMDDIEVTETVDTVVERLQNVRDAALRIQS